MIRHTFRFLPGIGPTIERRCWDAGITHWDKYISSSTIHGVGPGKKLFHNAELQRYKQALLDENHKRFARWPQSTIWRIYTAFAESVLCLDIETDAHRDITVVGVHDGTTRQYVRGQNLSHAALQKELSEAGLLLTFNGSSFDLPLLQQRLHLSIDIPHLDLCSLARQLDRATPLIKLEDEFSLPRECDVNAVKRWRQYQHTGNRPDHLLTYNRDDVTNLEPLADALVAEKKRSLDVPA